MMGRIASLSLCPTETRKQALALAADTAKDPLSFDVVTAVVQAKFQGVNQTILRGAIQRYGSGLRRFSDFPEQCDKEAMNKIGTLKVLDDQDNRELVSKLPKRAIVRWSLVVHQFKTEQGTIPPFSEFVKFPSRD